MTEDKPTMTAEELAVHAMRMIIEYRKAYEYCMSRQMECRGCSFFDRGNCICTKKSTKDVLFQAADIFAEFLDD
jgi:hypothetical protein